MTGTGPFFAPGRRPTCCPTHQIAPQRTLGCEGGDLLYEPAGPGRVVDHVVRLLRGVPAGSRRQVSDQPIPNGHAGPTANEIAGLVGAERTAGEYVPVPKVSAPESTGTKISGTAAVAAAEQRAAATAGRNIEDIPPLPTPADTANARSGPALHSACIALLPLVGVWRG